VKNVLRTLAFIGLFAVTTGLIGCKAKIEGGPENVPAPVVNDGFFDEKPTIQGPVVEGSWKSNCIERSGKTSRFFEFQFKDQQVVRTENTFSDLKCQTVAKKETNHGRFRFIEHYADDTYQVEYAFDLGSGVTGFPQEKLKLMQGKLYFTNFHVGEFAEVLVDEALESVGSSQPVPQPPAPVPPAPPIATDPNNIVGQQAQTLWGAKYAFCNVQGIAYLIDFKGHVLSEVSQGTLQAAYRRCNQVQPFKESGETAFTIVRDGANAEIRFGQSSYIKIYRGGLKGADAVIGGNSGMCTFLINKGVKDVFSNNGMWTCN